MRQQTSTAITKEVWRFSLVSFLCLAGEVADDACHSSLSNSTVLVICHGSIWKGLPSVCNQDYTSLKSKLS